MPFTAPVKGAKYRAISWSKIHLSCSNFMVDIVRVPAPLAQIRLKRMT